jgi:hypothetical protein
VAEGLVPGLPLIGAIDLPGLAAHDERATLVNAVPEGKTVKITFLGKDSTPNDSPTLYATDRETYLVQGYVVTDPEALSNMRIPDGKTVVEVPVRLMKYLPEDSHAEGDG